MIPAGRSVERGQSIAYAKFDIQTLSDTARWKRVRVDKNITGVNTPVPDDKIEIQIWCETNNNGHFDINDTFISKGAFDNGTCYLNMNSRQITTAQQTYYIVYKLANDIGGGQRAGVKIDNSSWLEFEDATCIGVPE